MGGGRDGHGHDDDEDGGGGGGGEQGRHRSPHARAQVTPSPLALAAPGGRVTLPFSRAPRARQSACRFRGGSPRQ